jgi:plastocyanin
MRLSSTFVASLLAVAAVAACHSPTGPGSGSTTAVAIRNFVFSPATISVKVGTTVGWTNAGPSTHTTTSDGGVWDSRPLGVGGTFKFTFTQPGTYGYHCSIHPPNLYPAFTGTVTVTP